MKLLKTVLLSILLAVSVVPTVGHAEALTYRHLDEELFLITFPDDWFVDSDFVADARAAGTMKGGEPALRILEAMPGDGTKLWFGIWVAPEKVTDLETALEYAASLDGYLFTDVRSSQPRDTTLGGMPAKTFSGLARRLGEEVEFAAALFQPRAEVVTVALYVGRPQTWARHRDALEQIVDSIKPAAR